MKKFKFRLETTLRYRETIEHLREQEFFEAQAHLQTVEMRYSELENTIRQTVTARPGGAIGERFDAPVLYDRERYVQTLQTALDSLRHQLDAARIVAAQARHNLVVARQAREAVSHLRENALQTHTQLMLKTEQDAMDEMATLRHTRNLKKAA